jgi:hypothetical protein
LPWWGERPREPVFADGHDGSRDARPAKTLKNEEFRRFLAHLNDSDARLDGSDVRPNRPDARRRGSAVCRKVSLVHPKESDGCRSSSDRPLNVPVTPLNDPDVQWKDSDVPPEDSTVRAIKLPCSLRKGEFAEGRIGRPTLHGRFSQNDAL